MGFISLRHMVIIVNSMNLGIMVFVVSYQKGRDLWSSWSHRIHNITLNSESKLMQVIEDINFLIVKRKWKSSEEYDM